MPPEVRLTCYLGELIRRPTRGPSAVNGQCRWVHISKYSNQTSALTPQLLYLLPLPPIFPPSHRSPLYTHQTHTQLQQFLPPRSKRPSRELGVGSSLGLTLAKVNTALLLALEWSEDSDWIIESNLRRSVYVWMGMIGVWGKEKDILFIVVHWVVVGLLCPRNI